MSAGGVSLNTMLEQANKAWHGVRLNQPDWGDGSHSLALGAELRQEGLLFHLILNAYWEPLDVRAAEPGGRRRRGGDGSTRRSIRPHDIVPWQEAPAVPGLTYRAEARSVVMLYAVNGPDGFATSSEGLDRRAIP